MTPINELTTETAARALWHAWLSAWFDGNAHAVGNQPAVTFPKVTLGFDQSPITQPLTEVPTGTEPIEIRVTIAPVRDGVDNVDGGQLATGRVIFNFWVRSRYQDPGQSRRKALEVAQLLKAILTNPAARVDLARNGVTHLAPRPPGLVSDRDWIIYLLACPGELSYEIKF